MKQKQTYRFLRENSIIYNLPDEYSLTYAEYHSLYAFFVTYSMCKGQSNKCRNCTDYGWPDATFYKSGLQKSLERILKLNKNSNFIFTDQDDLKEQFEKLNLQDGVPEDICTERAVIGHTNENSQYLKLFYRIRNGLAHGKFSLRFNSQGEKMVVIQDDDHNNVTARIVIKLKTLLDFITVTDFKGILSKDGDFEAMTIAS